MPDIKSPDINLKYSSAQLSDCFDKINSNSDGCHGQHHENGNEVTLILFSLEYVYTWILEFTNVAKVTDTQL